MKKIFSSVLVFSLSIISSGQVDIYTTVGTQTFVAPSGVLTVKVQCIGAGGAGGRVTPANIFDDDAAGGGGGGAYAEGIVSVNGGSTYDVVVGAGGINDGTSTNGGDSYFANGLEVLASGGETRSGNDNVTGAGGGLAINSVGAIKYNGGIGGTGDEGDTNGGGGGGAAGTSGAGSNGGELLAGGSTADYGGHGGAGGADGDFGDAGGNYGGGGGGSSCNGSDDRNGGEGAGGLVIISWSEILSLTPNTVCSGGEVVVSGSNFSGTDSVILNGLQIPFSVTNDNELVLTIPALATSGEIIIYTPKGASQSIETLTISSGTVTINADVTGTILTANYSGDNSSSTFQWLDCINMNDSIVGATDSVYNVTQNGLYAITVNENGCIVTSDCFTVISTSVVENTFQNQIKLYPQPTTGIVFVETTETISNLTIYNLNGEVVFQLSDSENQTQLDLEFLPAGVYSLTVNSGSDLYMTKLILVR